MKEDKYIRYVFDLWADGWRRKCARGWVVVVRFADDFVAGFQYREDAERFWGELRERFEKFNLRLQEDKTRLIEFGKFAAENQRRRGDGKPESFAFLGVLHVCDTSRKGKFIVLRQTLRQRMRAKLKGIKVELRRRLQNPIPAVGQWLPTVLLGHYRYFGVPCNKRNLEAFRYQISRLWYPSPLSAQSETPPDDREDASSGKNMASPAANRAYISRFSPGRHDLR